MLDGDVAQKQPKMRKVPFSVKHNNVSCVDRRRKCSRAFIMRKQARQQSYQPKLAFCHKKATIKRANKYIDLRCRQVEKNGTYIEPSCGNSRQIGTYNNVTSLVLHAVREKKKLESQKQLIRYSWPFFSKEDFSLHDQGRESHFWCIVQYFFRSMNSCTLRFGELGKKIGLLSLGHNRISE